MKLYSLVLLLSSVTLCCCQLDPVYELPANAAQLLTGDSLKSWKLAYRYNRGIRVSMGALLLWL